MREVVEKFNVFTFNEASRELKDKIIQEFANDSFLCESFMDERIQTLKEYAKFINGKLDYSFSCVPDRGEFITIKDFDQELFKKSFELKDCALTGVCYDDNLIYFLNKYGCLSTALNCYLKDIHNEYESMLTDEYIGDLCEANDYEFTQDGKLY